ncbi:MAG TPA: isochorismatase family cysteine hydrolase, partial [Roseomonas sp.]
MSTLLLLIDLQVAFCDPDGSIARQGRNISALARAASVCDALAEEARAHGVPVAWTRHVLRPDYADGGGLIRMRPNLARIGALRAGTPDVALSALVRALPQDLVIDKPRYSALYATSLEAILRSLGARRVLVGGVTTSMCVETTVRDLAQRDHEVSVIAEACSDFDAARHAASLEAMAFGFAPVINQESAAAILAEPAPP